MATGGVENVGYFGAGFTEGVTVSVGGSLNIYVSGTDKDASVNSGGTINVSSGGTADHTSVGPAAP